MRLQLVSRNIRLCLMLLAAGCGSAPSEPAPSRSATLVVQVDGAVKRRQPAPAVVPGRERPVATLVDEKGREAAFVANELWLSSDDDREVAALAARWRGEVIATI